MNLHSWQIRAYRVLQTHDRKDESFAAGYSRRSRELAFQLDKIASRFAPRFVCGEFPHGGAKAARALAYMCMANSIVSVFCALRDLELLAVTPTEIKRLVRPKGPVDKVEVEEVVEKFFGKFLPAKKEFREHMSDAAAAALVARKKYSHLF